MHFVNALCFREEWCSSLKWTKSTKTLLQRSHKVRKLLHLSCCQSCSCCASASWRSAMPCGWTSVLRLQDHWRSVGETELLPQDLAHEHNRAFPYYVIKPSRLHKQMQLYFDLKRNQALSQILTTRSCSTRTNKTWRYVIHEVTVWECGGTDERCVQVLQNA